VNALISAPWRKFMYVEMYYFQHWWADPRTTEVARNQLRTLLATKQWEFVEGGWVMPDEATTTFSAVLDQLTEGHLFLNKTFGVTPRIGWQIDPFGASTAIASHYLDAGFKYHVIDRINYKVRKQLIHDQQMEFFWSPADSNPSAKIFTHILDDNYCEPMNEGFDFESGDFAQNPPVTNDNIKSRASQYAQQVRMRQPMWKTSTMLMLHQCDFKYQKAHLQFDNMDKIIDFINANPQIYNMSIKWSLLSDYFAALESKYAPSIWPTRANKDFFPYDDNDDSWWTGYFTSRPGLKGLVRQSEAELRNVDNLSSYLAASSKGAGRRISVPGLSPDIDQLHQALGIAQHHDAVSGTEKQAVAENYAALLWRARAKTTPSILNFLNAIATSPFLPFSNPGFTNSTLQVQTLASGSSITVLIYNSLYKTRIEVIKIPVWHPDITVSSRGSLIQSQILFNLDQNEAGSPYTLFVTQQRIPPAGFITLQLSRPFTPGSYPNIPTSSSGTVNNGDLTVDVEDGYMKEIVINSKGIPVPFVQYLMAYDSYPGPGQASGAYIFRPMGAAGDLPKPAVTIRDTDLVKEIFQQYTPYASVTTRLYKQSGSYMDVSYRIGPLPGNKELISRWDTGIFTNQGSLFTDDNAWSVLQRSWDSSDVLSIPANYYPSVYASYLQPMDGAEPIGVHFAVCTDRSQGVSSQDDGSMEMMIHRRLLQDDARGVEEPLNDTTIIVANHRLVFGANFHQGTAFRHHHSLELNFPLAFYFSNASNYETFYRTSFNASYGMKHGIHIISTRLIDQASNRILVRIANMFSTFENGQLIVVDLTQVFRSSICSIVETSATGMWPRGRITSPVSFAPKQIRTFIFTPC